MILQTRQPDQYTVFRRGKGKGGKREDEKKKKGGKGKKRNVDLLNVTYSKRAIIKQIPVVDKIC